MCFPSPHCLQDMKQILNNSIREPLVHFIALGTLIYLVDILIFSSKNSNEQDVIVLNENVKQTLVSEFTALNKREPTTREVQIITDEWLNLELLYRKGVALGFDKDDPLIRDRVIQKTEYFLHNTTLVDEPSDSELRTWYQSRTADYHPPAKFDFDQVFYGATEEDAETQAKSALIQLVNGDAVLDNFQSRLHHFNGRSKASVQVIYGEKFASQIDFLELNRWQLIQSVKGWHIVRLINKSQEPAPEFEEIKPMVLSDWKKYKKRKQLQEVVANLRQDYQIIDELAL